MSMSKMESTENLSRVDNLIKLYETLLHSNIASENERSEILRSVVVFLHSTIEELVRNLFIERLPNQSREVLDEIPFSIHTSSHRAKGILLGELIKSYNGRFIENILLESINSYVDAMNVNNTTQLSIQLSKVGINISDVSAEFASIDALMARRHQIVHQMDRSDPLDPHSSPISEIGLSEVSMWRNSVSNLVIYCTKDDI